MQRNNIIDITRCIGNYMIVILHAGAAFQYCLPETREYNFWTIICWGFCPMALPTMFFISGYLLFSKYQYSEYTSKIRRRLKRLVIPYFIWNITFVLFYLVLGYLVPRLNDRVSSFGLDTLNGALEKIMSFTIAPIDGPLWFLRTLFIFSLFAPLFWLLLKNKAGRIAGFILLIVLYFKSYESGIINQLSMTYPLFGLTTFYLGGLMSATKNYGGKFNWFSSPIWIPVFVVGFIISIYIISLNKIDYSNGESLLKDISKIMMTPAIFYAATKFNINNIAKNKVFLYMKDMSFFAYAGHFLFCSMIMHTVAPFLGFMTTGKFTVLVSIFCGIGVPVMAGIYWFGKKYLPHTMKLYDGTL